MIYIDIPLTSRKDAMTRFQHFPLHLRAESGPRCGGRAWITRSSDASGGAEMSGDLPDMVMTTYFFDIENGHRNRKFSHKQW